MLKKEMKGGQPFTVELFAQNADTTPVDFTGYTALAQLNSGTPQGCTVEAWDSTTSPEFTILPGHVTLTIPGASTIEYCFPVGFIQIQMTHPTLPWLSSDKIQIALDQSSVQIPA